jgi:small-conductance mechanosensitive channel
MKNFADWMDLVETILDFPLLGSADLQITVGTLVYLIFLLVLVFFFAGKIAHWMSGCLLARSGVEIGVRQAVGTILWYAIVAIGCLMDCTSSSGCGAQR